ncbi:hypothetical protein [uncultured Chryseobacterium sp.]|uniref:hypothetical protein n=1 Tax=uncultured Chryseobacterium sp. TaxID=259322 RepID=UPI0025EE949D|nr:hypothetical protein [uncultured Chryseobacterium sp.]
MILRFSKDLCNCVFPTRFERMDKEGNIEMIRLVQGTNEVVQSKQDKNAKSKIFRTGFPNIQEGTDVYYQTEIDDKAVLNYLMKTAYWGSLIQEYDPIAVSKKESKAATAEIAVLSEITKITDNIDLLSIGYALYGTEALQYGKDNNYEGLRVNILKTAMEENAAVAKLLADKGKSDYMLLALAFAKGIIAEGEAGNSVVWGDENGATILRITLGERPIDSLISFFDTSDGQEIRQMIGLKIEAATKKATVKASTSKVKTDETSGDKANTTKEKTEETAADKGSAAKAKTEEKQDEKA